MDRKKIASMIYQIFYFFFSEGGGVMNWRGPPIGSYNFFRHRSHFDKSHFTHKLLTPIDRDPVPHNHIVKREYLFFTRNRSMRRVTEKWTIRASHRRIRIQPIIRDSFQSLNCIDNGGGDEEVSFKMLVTRIKFF